MFLGGISACFALYLSAFIYKMGWLLYLAIFDQGFLAFFIIPTLYKIIHTGHLVFIFFSCLFSSQSLYLSDFFSLFLFLYFRHYVLLYILHQSKKLEYDFYTFEVNFHKTNYPKKVNYFRVLLRFFLLFLLNTN